MELIGALVLMGFFMRSVCKGRLGLGRAKDQICRLGKRGKALRSESEIVMGVFAVLLNKFSSLAQFNPHI